MKSKQANDNPDTAVNITVSFAEAATIVLAVERLGRSKMATPNVDGILGALKGSIANDCPQYLVNIYDYTADYYLKNEAKYPHAPVE